MKLRNRLFAALASAAFLAVGALTFNGCTTTTTVTTGTNGVPVTNTVSTLDTNKIVAAIDAVVPAGVALAVQKAPQARPYLMDAAIAIAAFTSTNGVDPNQLNTAITSAVGADTLDPSAIAAIDAGVAVYRAFYGDAIAAKLDTSWAGPVLNHLSNDILNGLAGKTTP